MERMRRRGRGLGKYIAIVLTLAFAPTGGQSALADAVSGTDFGPSLLLGLGQTIGLGEPANQVRGFYSNGSLQAPNGLAVAGPGFVRLFRGRDRGHGSHGLIDLLEKTAVELAARFPAGERLQIGDLSARRGGEISGHASHQNGLDVDLAFFRSDRREQDLADESGFAEVMVTPDGKLTPNFDLERNWALAEALVASGRVARIFVDPAIKRAFCALKASEAETLRRLRPYANHADHYHARLTCPGESPGCLKQDDVAPGSGCETVERETPGLSEAEDGGPLESEPGE